MEQVCNTVCIRLSTGLYAPDSVEPWDVVGEFYERPQLQKLMKCDDETTLYNRREYERFQEIRFQNFILQTDHERNNHCFLSGKIILRLTKILRHIETREVFFVGKSYDCTSQFVLPELESEKIGMWLCSRRTEISVMYPLSQLQDKCFAYPVEEREDSINWAVILFLH
jgi:hypothetical protein